MILNLYDDLRERICDDDEVQDYAEYQHLHQCVDWMEATNVPYVSSVFQAIWWENQWKKHSL